MKFTEFLLEIVWPDCHGPMSGQTQQRVTDALQISLES